MQTTMEKNLTNESTMEEVVDFFLKWNKVTHVDANRLVSKLNRVFNSYVDLDKEVKRLNNFYKDVTRDSYPDEHPIQVNDYLDTPNTGVFRLTVDCSSFLWVVFKRNYQVLDVIGTAITTYSDFKENPYEKKMIVAGKELVTEVAKPKFLHQSNMGTGLDIQYNETCYEGLIMSMFVEIEIEGLKQGYMSSY